VLRQSYNIDFSVYMWAPDDGLCKPKHVEAIIVVLKFFNNSVILE